ncbi:hypothetical protein [Rarobacter faecitabidus]|uniref:hypothetical protein n=1 Tax=Rarobacter faecitabidus TaxID=13243 RepID=UPI001153F3CF|nr:hypothetical protein [Rarobacter faecitabidus]
MVLVAAAIVGTYRAQNESGSRPSPHSLAGGAPDAPLTSGGNHTGSGDDDGSSTGQDDQVAEHLDDAGMYGKQVAGEIAPDAWEVIEDTTRAFFDVDPRNGVQVMTAAAAAGKFMTPDADDATARIVNRDAAAWSLFNKQLEADESKLQLDAITDAGQPIGSPPDTSTRVTRAAVVTWSHRSANDWKIAESSNVFTFTLVAMDDGSWLVSNHDLMWSIPVQDFWYGDPEQKGE